jgi:hypothetical protein
MGRMLPRSSLRLLAVLFPLGLSACADSMTQDQVTSLTTLRRGYDKTLTKEEQQAAISDLEKSGSHSPASGTPNSAASGAANSTAAAPQKAN